MKVVILTEKLAQNLVSETSRIIEHDIEIIDSTGKIIAASDNAKVNQPADLLDQIKEASQKSYITEKNKTYTTLPIEFNNEKVGFIKLEGYPHKVSRFAMMIKVALEAALLEVSQEKQSEMERRLREEVLQELIFGTDTPAVTWNKARQLKIDLNDGRIAAVFEVLPLQGESDKKQTAAKKITASLYRNLSAKDLVASPLPNVVVVLKHIPMSEKDDFLNVAQFDIETMIAGIEEEFEVTVKGGIGRRFNSIDHASESYKAAMMTLKAGKILYPEKNVYTYESLSYFTLLGDASDKQEYEDLITPYHQIVMGDKTGELRETFKAYVNENGDQKGASEAVFIHRNTLRYRLEKIHRLTGKNPRDLKDLIQLYASMMLYEFTQLQEN
ncbi:sugar diacid recognition domain-containing protein [Bacillus marinisedimentorum]|uniref:sugar diacid recognition domain-containing protein n=1 Tax=Bacillus marinisedimentorum TaxID=1821260 RepID=UPI001471E487|nr:sugar diacid recognition domain-containing protein [Bacillus marinisedimentorum]